MADLSPVDDCLDNVVGDSVEGVVDAVDIDNDGGDFWYLHEGPKYFGSSSGKLNKVQISLVGHEVKVVASTLEPISAKSLMDQKDKNQ